MLPFVTRACDVSISCATSQCSEDPTSVESCYPSTYILTPVAITKTMWFCCSTTASTNDDLQCRFRSVLEMRAAMRDFARAARDYSRRYSAAIKMQSLARGFLARRAFAHLVAAHQRRQRLEQADRAAALAVIAPWAGTFAARSHFLRLRCVH